MDDHHADRRTSGGGLSRRDVMRRGALLAGASVWATPAVQTLARPAFADPGTPGDFSFFAFVWATTDDSGDTNVLESPEETTTAEASTLADSLDQDEAKYQAKYDEDRGDPGDWDPDPGGEPGVSCTGQIDYEQRPGERHRVSGAGWWAGPDFLDETTARFVYVGAEQLVEGSVNGVTFQAGSCHPAAVRDGGHVIDFPLFP